jgi:hypothetical protein
VSDACGLHPKWVLCYERMFEIRSRSLLVVLVIGLLATVSFARAMPGEPVEARYVVRAGDTLWAIAVERYDGDPREAVWRIKQRNGLSTSALAPGMVLALPG